MATMEPKKRRLHLPSLNPQRPSQNCDDCGATFASGSSTVHSRHNRHATSPTTISSSNNAEGSNSGEEPTATYSIGSMRSDRVLRYGETVDSLFCLDIAKSSLVAAADDDESSGDERDRQHKSLCREICTTKSDDAKSWVEALRYTLLTLQHVNCNINNEDGTGKRIIILHRRAVGRFKSNSSSHSHHSNGDGDEILKIWLLYAIVQLNFDSLKASVETLRHVQRVFYPEEGREFWRAVLILEGDDSTAVNSATVDVNDAAVILERFKRKLDGGEMTMVDCVDEQWRGFKSRGLLHTVVTGADTQNGGAKSKIALPCLNQRAGLATTTSATVARDDVKSQAAHHDTSATTQQNSNDQAQQTKSILSTTTARQSIQSAPEAEQSKRITIKSATTCKRPSIDDNSQSTQEKSKCNRSKRMEARKKARTDRLAARTTKSGKREVSISAILSQTMDDGGESGEEEADARQTNQSRIHQNSKKSTPETDTNWPMHSDHCNNNDNANNALLPSSAPDSDQARKHFKENISPIEEGTTASIKDMDLGYLLNWDPIKDRETKKRVTIVAREDDARKTLDKESEKKRIVPKITRNDLGYMMNWEPFPKRDDNNGSSGGSTAETKRKGRDNGNMSRIEEETEASASVGANDAKVSSCSRDENDDASSAAAPEEEEDQKRSSVDTITAQHAKNNSKHYSRSEKSTDADTISMPDVEQSFLPLIETNNIIKVDNEPYAKLGVIGKGGSCKVYRALSRECDVVALKKVKLDGLNKQAIDGYANEIALLNRLKGNPAIIQLYSSQVDLERKSIYLVMELGEVDLNYVLRQQELLSSKQGKGGRSSLNMNFIRLTWQQMLSAVHSIHEERIVHSDLKPANFLFVRGALKLIDFGIAKAIESHDTTNVYRETLSGTLSYMSPEVLMDTSTNANGVRINKCGRASDIWSLGCILYQMVYGKTPFADCHGIPQKLMAITNPNHRIDFPDDNVDEAAIDAMKLCLERNPKLRATIVGKNGLLNEHVFLHSRSRR